MGDMKWGLTPEDMGPVLAALKLVIDEIDRDLLPNYGIELAAKRVLWKTDLQRVARQLTQPTVTKLQKEFLWIRLPLSAEEACSCGYALLVAANHLDHFTGVEGLRGDPLAETFVLPYDRSPWIVDLVKQHFSPIADDIAWVRQESLRLRLHAHYLLEHGD